MNTEWMKDANCKGMTDVFFPEKEAYGGAHTATAAYGVCAACPVRRECGEYALWLRPRPMFGVWAGRPARAIRLAGRERDRVR